MNISNEHPTMSVNDCIRIHNLDSASHRSPLPPLSIEETLALTFNQLELYLGKYEARELEAIEDVYYKYWLHRYASKIYSGAPLKDTPKIRTPLYLGHFTVSQICFLSNLPRNEDTSLYRTLHQVSKVSTMEGFHCTLFSSF